MAASQQLARHANHTGKGRLMGLPALRVTSIAQFEACPRTWAGKFLDGVQEKENKYSAIGTAVHYIIERFFYDGWAVVDAAKDLKSELGQMWALVPEEERGNVVQYLTSLTELTGYKVLALEHEFTLEMMPNALPIRGHMDCVMENAHGELVILDHKTNRQYEGVEDWQSKLQPLLYAWAARKTWPHYDVVRFRIGYVNLGTCVEWVTNRSDDVALLNRIQKVWEEMVACDAAGHFPEAFNENCGYCPLKERCQAYRSAVLEFQDSIQDILTQKPLHERYVWVVNVRKAVDKLEEELKAELAQKVDAANGILQLDDFVFTLERSERRKAEFTPVLSALIQHEQEHPGFWAELLANHAADTFTVKVTGLDKLISKYPELRSVLQPLAPKVPAEHPTLKFQGALKRLPAN